jgi:hypothetical protein
MEWRMVGIERIARFVAHRIVSSFPMMGRSQVQGGAQVIRATWHLTTCTRPPGGLANGSHRERDLIVGRPVVVGVATVPARVEDRTSEYCQGQHSQCDYQREHRLLLSATNGTMEQMPERGTEGAETFHSICRLGSVGWVRFARPGR